MPGREAIMKKVTEVCKRLVVAGDPGNSVLLEAGAQGMVSEHDIRESNKGLVKYGVIHLNLIL